jgi:hypothetical protein
MKKREWNSEEQKYHITASINQPNGIFVLVIFLHMAVRDLGDNERVLKNDKSIHIDSQYVNHN